MSPKDQQRAPAETRPGEVAAHRCARRSPAGLVGRERELRLLLEATLDPPALILVEGEAGVGKSALVRAMIAAPPIRGRRVLVGHCHRLREPFVLGPVVEALCGLTARPSLGPLGPVVGALHQILPELAGVLPAQPAPLRDPRAERHRIFRALRELFAALGPTACVLEDVHWADESTLELLGFLASDPPEGLSLLVTYRDEHLSPVPSLLAATAGLRIGARKACVRVLPLSVDEVARMSCGLLETETVSNELARHLHGQTAGLPFALEEVVRLHRGQLERVDGWRTVAELEHMRVPPAVQQTLRERMECLSADAWLVTRTVAVLAAPVGQELIGKVAGLRSTRTIKALSAALSAAVLEERPDGRFGFLHALAGQAVYDELSGPERRWLHRRAAEALGSGQEPRPLAQLAHHFGEADCPAQAARYCEAAADAATAVGDDRSAARLLEQALRSRGLSHPARVRLAVKLGAAALYSADPGRAITSLEDVRDAERVPVPVRGELRYRIARLRYQIGDVGAWRAEMERAVGELSSRPNLAACAMITLAWPVVGQGDVADDLAWLGRAEEAAARADDPAVRVAVAGQRAAILVCLGGREGWRAAERLPRRGRSPEESLELLSAYQSLAATATGLGSFGRAEDFLRAVAVLVDELPYVSWSPWLKSARAALDWRTGRWTGLEERLRAMAEHGTGGPALAVSNEMILAALVLSRSRIQEAEQRFTAIRDRAEARGWMGAGIAAASGLARILLARGDAHGAAEAAARGLAVLERKGIWVWGRELVPVAVQALVARGDLAAGIALTERFTSAVEGCDAPAARAAGRFCRAVVAEAEGLHAAAARGFAEAAAISSDLPAPYEAAAARAGQARCLLAAGDEDGAELLLGALTAYDELGAVWDGAQVRAELKKHDIPLPSQWRGGRRAYGNELSPREAEVAQLAGMGRKNREIAETLFISPRTVETHVASALRKLGADSRDAFADSLPAPGVGVA